MCFPWIDTHFPSLPLWWGNPLGNWIELETEPKLSTPDNFFFFFVKLDFTPTILRRLSSCSQEQVGKEHLIGLARVMLLPHLDRGRWLKSRWKVIGIPSAHCIYVGIWSVEIIYTLGLYSIDLFCAIPSTLWISDKCKALKGFELKIQIFLVFIFPFPLFIRTRYIAGESSSSCYELITYWLSKNLQEFVKGSHWGSVLALHFGECVYVCIRNVGVRGHKSSWMRGSMGSLHVCEITFVLFG